MVESEESPHRRERDSGRVAVMEVSNPMLGGEYRPPRVPVEEAVRTSAWLRERMAQRRTVRVFASEPVDERLVVDAIAAASTAPSGAHRRPWRFVPVTDQGIRARVREAAEAEERKSYDGRLGEEWLTALRQLGTDEHKPQLTDAPYLIVVFGQRYYLDEETGAKHKHCYSWARSWGGRGTRRRSR